LNNSADLKTKGKPRWHQYAHRSDSRWSYVLSRSDSGRDWIKFEISRYRGFGFGLDVGKEETQLGFYFYAFGRWVSLGLNHLPLPKWLTGVRETTRWNGEPCEPWYSPRELNLGLSVQPSYETLPELFICLNLLSKISGDAYANAGEFRGPSIYLHPFDWLLGRIDYAIETLQSTSTSIEIDSKVYPVTVEIERATWTRKRYWKRLQILRADVTLPENHDGIPTGKHKFGAPSHTQAWSFCLAEDGDAIAEPVAMAVAKVKDSVMEDREKYGYYRRD
jgi:hypothetical protein